MTTLTGRRLLTMAMVALTAVAGWAMLRTTTPLELRRPAAPAPAPEPASAGAPLAPSASTLYVLSIGVSRYAESGLRLRYADADARGVAEALDKAGHAGLYRDVHTLVLTNEQVTRESILGSMERFFAPAGPDDVAVLFLAGHGVRDLASGSYFFLPYAANSQNLVTEGLRMSDFDDTLRVLRRNVRAVVVMLDTCHSGALNIPSSRVVSADEMAAQVSAGEGFFLLAATRPGEESKETSDLGHGAFTYALIEALGGAADADGDGIVTVSELFAFVARRVPQLTHGEQHPYHKTEGTDLAVLATGAEPVSPPAEAPIPPPVVRTPDDVPPSNVIGVMEFQNLRADPQYDWISKALRVAFNTELSKVRVLRVYSPELIDRAARARGADDLYTARQLGIGRLLTGSFHVTDKTLRIDARIVNASTGVNEASDSVEGKLDQFFELQKDLVLSMLRRLKVQVSVEEGASIQTRTNTDVDAYKLLLEAEGVVERSPHSERTHPSGSTPGPQSRAHVRAETFFAWLASPVYGEESQEASQGDVMQLLEEYRHALEEKNIDRVAELSQSFSDRQREALQAYLDNAKELRVELADVVITRKEDTVAVSFTRRDRFVDRETDRPVRLEVRLAKLVVRDDDHWKLGGQR
jgi:uncharacterized caspase-like protein/TolB-like protein